MSIHAVKIRRTNLLDVVHNALTGPRDDRGPEELLLAERDERQRKWRDHLHTYISVNSGLIVMNLVMATFAGSLVPWFIFPAIGWGMGLSAHGLNHRAWMSDNRARITAAEARLGIAPPSTPLLTAPTDTVDPWDQLLESCDQAVRRAKTLITEVHPAATGAVVDLEEGLATIERLAMGAQRIQAVLEGLAPRGREGLERQIAQLDAQITQTEDAGLKEAHLANRALMISRRAKLEALIADRDRMFAKAQGFLLAVENLHLDAARVSSPEVLDTLSTPIGRLTEEVQILRKVDDELKRVS